MNKFKILKNAPKHSVTFSLTSTCEHLLIVSLFKSQ